MNVPQRHLRYFHPRRYPSIRLKINAQQGFPWQLSIQPVSRGWIGLDAERAEVILLSAKLYRVYHKN